MGSDRPNITTSCPAGTIRVPVDDRTTCVTIHTSGDRGFLIADSGDIWPKLTWLLRGGDVVPLHELPADIARRQRIAAGPGPTAAIAVSELAASVQWMDGLDASIVAAITSIPAPTRAPTPSTGTASLGPFRVGSLTISLADHALPGTPRTPSASEATILRNRLTALRTEVQGLRRQSVYSSP